jgi:hypothetical protein
MAEGNAFSERPREPDKPANGPPPELWSRWHGEQISAARAAKGRPQSFLLGGGHGDAWEPWMDEQAREWETRLARVGVPPMTLARLEAVVEGCVRGELERLAHPDARTTALGWLGLSIFDFSEPIRGWLDFVASDAQLRDSAPRSEELLKTILLDHLRRLEQDRPAAAPAARPSLWARARERLRALARAARDFLRRLLRLDRAG